MLNNCIEHLAIRTLCSPFLSQERQFPILNLIFINLSHLITKNVAVLDEKLKLYLFLSFNLKLNFYGSWERYLFRYLISNFLFIF